jgi:hypothetical protein
LFIAVSFPGLSKQKGGKPSLRQSPRNKKNRLFDRIKFQVALTCFVRRFASKLLGQSVNLVAHRWTKLRLSGLKKYDRIEHIVSQDSVDYQGEIVPKFVKEWGLVFKLRC